MSLLSAPGHVLRLFRIGATLARAGVGTAVIERANLHGWRAGVIRLASGVISPFGLKGDRSVPPLPCALMALGPAEVKLGQTLATRPDVVGAEAAQELRQLQDRVPSFPEKDARAAVERELGQPIEALFTEFGPPIAAASIAQVHKAVTTDGETVAVKVLRPGVEDSFLNEIAALSFAARVVERILPASRRLKPVAVYQHFAETTKIELDLRLEASAGSEFADRTADDQGFRVPRVDWERSGQRVLTMEWIDGTPIGDNEALLEQGHNLSRIADKIIQSFLNHALRDGFFHADMHQGNLRVDEQGRVVALDFGIMGRLDPMSRRFYAEILYSFLNRDYMRAARVHREAGYLPADRDIDAFAQALRSVAEPIFGLGAKNISMGRLLSQLFAVTETFGMETRTELILLQKTMVMVEGVARSLDPDVNMWDSARPVVEAWIRENLGPAGVLRDLRESALILARLGPRLPQAAQRLVELSDNPQPIAAAPPARIGWLVPLLSALAGGAIGGGLVAILL